MADATSRPGHTRRPRARAAEPLQGAAPRRWRSALVVVTALFFMWGLITSLNDILVPHLKAAFALTYTQAMLIQLCFFGAYFVMSYPSGAFVEARGYKPGILLGLTVAGLGCILFYPAAGTRSYPFFLGALFVLASGITLLQVAANPYVTLLGPGESASSRLSLTQAFNSLGTTLGPYAGSLLILSDTRPAAGAAAASGPTRVQGPYLLLAAVLFLIALSVAVSRLPQRQELQGGAAPQPAEPEAHVRSLFSHPHLMLGAIAIFLYVGAEVAIGSLLVSFMGQRQIAALPAALAGQYLSLYWGGAMLGRFLGAAVMLRLAPARALAGSAAMAALLILTAVLGSGATAMWALLAVGLCNSIMFPTIFALALEGLGPLTGQASGLLCMAIVGGALVPELQGALADSIGVQGSFVTPLVCYLYIAFYGLRGHRLRRPAKASATGPGLSPNA